MSSITSREAERGRTTHLAPLVGYGLLSVVVLSPAVLRFRSEAMVGDADGAMFSWLWWLMPRSIAEGGNPLRTDMVFHPVGVDLSLTTFAPLVGALTWPVRALLGESAQVNTVQLGAMLLAGWGAHRLALHVCRDQRAAFVGGAAYALLPVRFVHVEEHLNLVATGLIPLTVLAFLRLLGGPGRRRVVVLALWLGGTFLVEPQLAVLAIVVMAVLAATHRRDARANLTRLAASGGIALLVAAPLLVPMGISLASGGVGETDSTGESFIYAASPVSWIVPPSDRVRSGVGAPAEEVTPTIEGVAFPGYVVLALAVVAVARAPRSMRTGWVAVAGVGIVLSFGPYLLVGDRHLDVPLPFFFFRALPGIGTMRVPGRFALVGGLGLVVLASIGLTTLIQRRPRRAGLFLVAAFALTLLELWPAHLRSREPVPPAVYEAIRDDGAAGAVLELPLKWSMSQGHLGFRGHDENFRFLLAAEIHERPIVSGAVSRLADERLTELLDIPVYRQLLALGGEPGFSEPAGFVEDDLRRLGIGFVVYHRSDPAPSLLRYVQHLGLEELADDGDTIVWRVPDG